MVDSKLSSPATARKSGEILDDLRRTLAAAQRLADDLSAESAAPSDGADGDASRRLADAEREISELVERLVAAEHRASQLMNLYVATYQLYASQDPEDVHATIAEIAVDLLGAESFVLLLRGSQGQGSDCQVILANGLSPGSIFGGERYAGGDPMVDATLDDGVLRLERSEGSEALAVVPLRVQDTVVGSLVLLKLLDHKPALSPEDRDILDLLAAHAASALLAARAYVATTRKLQTLESLIQLMRG